MSPAQLKADGSSHSLGEFKLGGVRPARMGGLETTEGVRVRAQCTVFACKGPPGPSSVAALPTRTGPSRPSTRGQAGPIPTALPSPAQASPESAVVEQSSGCLRSGPPAHPSGAPRAIPGATALLWWNMGDRRNGGPFCMPWGAIAPRCLEPWGPSPAGHPAQA